MKRLAKPRKEALTAAIRDLIRVLGNEDAMSLIKVLPGARVSVPKLPKEDHPLRLALSPAGFDRLIAEWGGGLLEVPKGDAYLRQMRYDHVLQCRAQGMTVDETAKETGYCRRHVINIMEKPQPPTAVADAAPVSRAGWANDPFGLVAAR